MTVPRGTSALAGLILVGTIAALAIPEPRAEGMITGHATATDGDTLRIGSVRVRLFGIDAPENAQTCAGTPCGAAATQALRYMLTRDPAVTCVVKDTDRYGRTVAVCRNSEGDLGARQVALGHALDYTRYSRGAYRDQQEAAKAERLGMWSGTFQEPAQWRRENKR